MEIENVGFQKPTVKIKVKAETTQFDEPFGDIAGIFDEVLSNSSSRQVLRSHSEAEPSNGRVYGLRILGNQEVTELPSNFGRASLNSEQLYLNGLRIAEEEDYRIDPPETNPGNWRLVLLHPPVPGDSVLMDYDAQ